MNTSNCEIFLNLPIEIWQYHIFSFFSKEELKSLRLISCQFRSFISYHWKQWLPHAEYKNFIQIHQQWNWEIDVYGIYQVTNYAYIPPSIRGLDLSKVKFEKNPFENFPSLEILVLTWTSSRRAPISPESIIPYLKTKPNLKIYFLDNKIYHNLLYFACYFNNLELVKLLLSQKKNHYMLNEKNEGETVISVAAIRSSEEIVELILSHGGDPNIPHQEDGWTALMLAARNGRLEVVEKLLKYGAKKHTKNRAGNTALTFASLYSHCPVIDLLNKETNSSNE